MSQILKVDLTHMNKNILKTFVTLNDELRCLYAESEVFDKLQEFIDKNFIYTEEQLETLKTKFLKSR
jgi:hypothetical protein